MDMIAAFLLNMRINNGDHLALFGSNVVLHVNRCGKLDFVPGEILLSICVFDIQPKNVVRNIMSVKTCINSLYIVLVDVIPTALVISNTKIRGQCRTTSQVSKLV
eukprot:Lithocolla_globosa_v1_NODE_1210_length_2782_cov_63.330766.p3 type:complete len:105 gc:universal NODE_1210_length_2782_cov_63.330766:1259-945(-)